MLLGALCVCLLSTVVLLLDGRGFNRIGIFTFYNAAHEPFIPQQTSDARYVRKS